MGKSKIDRTGKVGHNTFGSKMVITRYGSATDIDVYFPEYDCIVKNQQYGNFKNGKIKCPYERSVYGIGYIGEGEYKTKENGKFTRVYEAWKSMLQRCYDTKLHELRPTYEEAVVCERWLVFANFLEDIPSIHDYEYWRDNPRQKIALDKDILGNGSKVYCLETTCFVSLSENSRESAIRTGLGR